MGTLEVLKALQPKHPSPEALVFANRRGKSLDAKNLPNRHLAPVCKQLKLPRISWHSFRHSNATMLDAVGAPLGTVQALLGHASSEITRSVYLHAIPEDQRKAVENVERLIFGPKWTAIRENQENTVLLTA